MTETGRRNRELNLKRDELEENKRHNRVSESIEKHKAGSSRDSAFGSILKGGASVAKALINSPEWYKKYPELAQYASKSLLFNAVGSRLTDTLPKGCLSYGMVHYYLDSVGPQAGINPLLYPINKELVALHTAIMSVNSRVTTVWDHGDLGQILFVWCSLAGELKRLGLAVRATLSDTPYSYNKANAIVRALGFNPHVVRQLVPQIKDFVYRNTLKLNQIPMPKDLSFIERKLFINGLLVSDQDLVSAQFYCVTPHGHLYYDETNAVAVRDISYNAITGIGNTVGQMQGYMLLLQNHIDRLFLSNSIKSMYTDIRAAYKESQLYQLQVQDLDKPLVLTVSDEVCTQLMNSTMVPAFGILLANVPTALTLVSANIQQDSNGFLVQHRVTYSSGQPSGIEMDFGKQGTCFTPNEEGVWLTFYKDDVSEDDVLTSTRMVTDWYVTSTTRDTVQARVCGTEVIIGTGMVITDDQADGGVNLADECFSFCYDVPVLAGAKRTVNDLTAMSRFNFAPYVYIVDSDDLEFGWWQQTGNSFFLPFTGVLERLHTACILSMLKFEPVLSTDYTNIRTKKR